MCSEYKFKQLMKANLSNSGEKTKYPKRANRSTSNGCPLSITGIRNTQPHQISDETERGNAINNSLSRKKQTIVCDYLELTTRGTIFRKNPGDPIPTEIILKSGLILKSASTDKKGNPIIVGTKHFQAKYNVFFPGEKDSIATVVCFPRPGGILADNLAQLKVDNRELYANGWTKRVKTLLSMLNVEINNISRLDIAIDSNCVSNDPFLGLHYSSPFIGIFERWERGELVSVGKIRGAKYFEGSKTTGFDRGTRTSSKYVTGYVKSERVDKENKTYIREFWQKNGIQNGDRVERLELKLKSDAIKRTVCPDTGNVGIDIFQLERGGYMAGIMQAHLKKFFEFKFTTGDKNKSRRDGFSTIDWDGLNAETLERIPTTKATNEIWGAKMAISKGLRDADKEYSRKSAKQAIGEAIADGAGQCGAAVVKVVQEHLKEVFPYSIPNDCFDGLDSKIARAIGSHVANVTSDDNAKSFNLSIYQGMAKAHGLQDFYKKKATFYAVGIVGMELPTLQKAVA